MESVVLEGVQYIKASALAKKFRYTPDYIGQLCRAKKIDARLVGRTWFVNPDSIIAHRNNKNKKHPAAVTAEKLISPENKYSTRKTVLPVINSKTAKATTNLATKVKGVGIRKLAVAYEPDEEMLIPNLVKKKVGPARAIRVEPANAQRLQVGGYQLQTSFSASELPEVSLSGKVPILAYPETEESNLSPEITEEKMAPKDYKNKEISFGQDTNESSTKEEMSLQDAVVTKQSGVDEKSKNPKKVKFPSGPKKKKVSLIDNISSPQSLKFTPTSISTEMNTVVRVSPLIATALALPIVLLILSASTQVIISEFDYDSKVVLQVANLLELLAH